MIAFAMALLTAVFFVVLNKKRHEAEMLRRQAANDAYGPGERPTDLWVPVDLTFESRVNPEVQVVMCRLSGQALLEHSLNPSELPMFRDLMGRHCGPAALRTVSLEKAFKAAETDAARKGKSLPDPAGFVFHESRVGSTLIANMLAAVPRFLVWTESKPPATALLYCPQCPAEQRLEILRKVMRLMCSSSFHTACFFKFQSATTPAMATVLAAFPKTPYVFLFRNPVQTLMSHMRNVRAVGGAPCLRSKQHPPPEVTSIFAEASGRKIREASPPEYCAAHLAYLCTSAEAVLMKEDSHRGMALDYSSLPGLFVDHVVSGHFGIKLGHSAKSRMLSASEAYSKSRSSTVKWQDDSKRKEDAANAAVQEAAKTILQPSFERLLQRAAKDMAHAKNYSGTIVTETGLSPQSAVSPKGWRMPQSQLVGGARPQWALFDRGEVSSTGESVPFEAVDCPDVPPRDYPRHYPILNVTSNWPPDDTRVPAKHFGSLCRFNYETELDKCFAYRDAEKPFVVYNVPEVEETVAKWSDLRYLSQRLGDKRYRTEHSLNNHFMYWGNFRPQKPGVHHPRVRNRDGTAWSPPTDIQKLTFDDFMHLALEGEEFDKRLDSEYFYFRVGDAEAPFIRDEDLTIFNGDVNLFMKDPNGQRGIHCRFGMRSVIAESHYDSTRNFVAQIGGARRWIMSRPEECKRMYLYPMDHPSGRHSEVDWSDPDVKQFPGFKKLQALDVVLHAGEVLYVPAYWFHYIVSLGVNYQCNSRSGKSKVGAKAIKDCGFAV